MPERYRWLAVKAFLQAELSEGQLMRYLGLSRLETRERVPEALDDVDAELVDEVAPVEPAQLELQDRLADQELLGAVDERALDRELPPPAR
ncbi:MAG: hypothetical protein HC794_04645 [Nitrospiraceae bacterium]|nr:hypothetical protein [Nitrospiraceae bacterium]